MQYFQYMEDTLLSLSVLCELKDVVKCPKQYLRLAHRWEQLASFLWLHPDKTGDGKLEKAAGGNGRDHIGSFIGHLRDKCVVKWGTRARSSLVDKQGVEDKPFSVRASCLDELLVRGKGCNFPLASLLYNNWPHGACCHAINSLVHFERYPFWANLGSTRLFQLAGEFGDSQVFLLWCSFVYL